MNKNNYYNQKLKVNCNFILNLKDNKHISYKHFGGCFEDENDSQYDWTIQDIEQKKDDRNIIYEDEIEE